MILETRHSIPEILSRQPLFRMLSPAELERLAIHGREYRLDRNEMPLQKGETSSGLHVVIVGQMKMCLPSMAGTEKVVRMLAPGDVFGEEGVLLGKPCPMAIQAVRDSLMLVLARASLMDVLAHNRLLSQALMTHLCARLCELVENLETCVQRNSQQRVAHYLMQMAPRGSETYDLTLDISKQTLASQLNLAPETLSRVLGRLVKDGCIRVEGRNITVKDLHALRGYAAA